MRSSSWAWLGLKRERERFAGAQRAASGTAAAALSHLRLSACVHEAISISRRPVGVALDWQFRVIRPDDAKETMTMPARAAGAIGFLQLVFDWCYRAADRLRRGVRARLARADRYDAVAAVLFGALLVLVALTFPDYAISNDEEVQQRYAELIVAYYQSGF